MRRLLILGQWVGKPLTIAQILSSAAGAGAMLIAAGFMQPSEFGRFALFTLTANLLTGLFRAALFQPALINQRKYRHAHVPGRYALIAALVSGVGMLATVYALGVRGAAPLIWLTTSAAVPTLYDWLRFRAMGMDRRWELAQADLMRVVLTVAALLSPTLRENSVGLQTYLSLSVLLPMLFLVWRLPSIPTWVPFRRYRRAAGWQLLDYLLGQSLNSLPLLVLGGATDVGPVAGVRFAQSLLGPLNLAYAAATSNLVVDGATRVEFAAEATVVARGTQIGRTIGLLAIAVVGGFGVFVWLSGFALKGVDNASILLGLILVGTSLITTGWANVHAVVLRVLDRQARVTIARGVIAVLTVGGFVVGYLVGGTTGSMVAGFLTLAVTAPLILLTMAARTYRTIR